MNKLNEILESFKPFKECDATTEYMSIVAKPEASEGEYHHILPRSLFPEYIKSEWNLVKLSYKDHHRVHCLLPMMVDGEHKTSMLYAWNLMCGRHKGFDMDATQYEIFRIELNSIISQANSGRKWTPEQVEARRIQMVGEGNHQYGKTGEQSVWFGKVGPNKDRVWSEEVIAKHSKRMTGEGNHMFGRHHSEETKKLIGAANSGEKSFWYGKTTTDKQKAAASKTARERVWTSDERKAVSDHASIEVRISGIVFSSQTVAAKHFNVSKSTIGKWVKSGKAEIIGEPKRKNRVGGGGKGKDANGATPVRIDGIDYDTINEAATALNKTRNTISAWIKSGKATKLPKE